jgi:hypothetical protein
LLQFLCVIVMKGSEDQALKKRHNTMRLWLRHWC